MVVAKKVTKKTTAEIDPAILLSLTTPKESPKLNTEQLINVGRTDFLPDIPEKTEETVITTIPNIDSTLFSFVNTLQLDDAKFSIFKTKFGTLFMVENSEFETTNCHLKKVASFDISYSFTNGITDLVSMNIRSLAFSDMTMYGDVNCMCLVNRHTKQHCFFVNEHYAMTGNELFNVVPTILYNDIVKYPASVGDAVNDVCNQITTIQARLYTSSLETIKKKASDLSSTIHHFTDIQTTLFDKTTDLIIQLCKCEQEYDEEYKNENELKYKRLLLNVQKRNETIQTIFYACQRLVHDTSILSKLNNTLDTLSSDLEDRLDKVCEKY